METVDVIHILHATRFLRWAREHQFALRKPYLVTMGGTDINIDLQTNLDEEAFNLLDNAAYITVFTPDAKRKTIALNEEWRDKTIIVPQSAWLPLDIGEPSQTEQPSILLPAGLRPVKDALHVLPALDDLIKTYPGLQFKIIGAKLDENVYKQVMEASKTRPWLNYVGVVPFEVMPRWYEESNIILNSSIAEGQSLAVMEALALGRPVIARRNKANEQLIRHRETGWLYETMDDFKNALFSIMNDPFHRDQVVETARKWIRERFSPDMEAKRYIELYKRAGK